MKVLIIEDDRDIAELVRYNLKQEKIEAQVCSSGSSGLAEARRSSPNLVILDLMLPDMGGLEVCKALKADPKTERIPVLMLTAKGEEVDRIVGFEVGADDYVTKPFSPRELVLRIKTILKRPYASEEKLKQFQFGDLKVDFAKPEVLYKGRNTPLTPVEMKLLQYLYATRGRVQSREILLDKVWGYNSEVTTRTVDVHVKRLREKLGGGESMVETIRGLGYRFREKP